MHVGAADYDYRPYIYNIPLFDSEAGDAQAADASGVHGPGGVSTEPLTPIAEGSAGELADSGGGSLLKLGNGDGGGGGGGGGNGALVQAAVEEAQSSGGGGGNDGRDVSGDGSGGVSHRSVPLVAEAQDVAAEDEPRPLASPGRLLGAVTGAVKGALGSLPGLNPRHKHHHSGAEAAVTAAAAAVVGVPAVCAAGGGAQASSRESQPLAAALAAAAGLMTSGTGGTGGERSGDGGSGGGAGEEFFERPSKREELAAAADAGGGQRTSAGGADTADASARSTKPLVGSSLAPLFGTNGALGFDRPGAGSGTAGPHAASEGTEGAESGSPARPTERGGVRGAEGTEATPGAATAATSSPDTSRRSGWLGRLSGFRAWAPSGQLLAEQGGSGGGGMARSVTSHASSGHTTAPPLPKAATIAAPRFEASREAAASGGAGARGGAAGGDGWGVAGRAAAVWGSALRWLAWALPGPLTSALRSGRLSSLAEASAAVRRAGKAAARALQGTPGVVGAALPPTGVAWPAALPADPRLTPPEAAGGDEGAVPRLHAAAVDANGGRTVGGSAAARSRESAKAAAVPAGVAGAGPDVAVAAPARGLMSAVGLLHIALSDIRLEAKDVYHFSVRVLPAALHACIVCDRLAFGTYPAATRMQHAASTRTMHHASHASNVLPLTCPLTAGEAKRAKRACANLCTCMPAQLQGGVHSLSQGGRELI